MISFHRALHRLSHHAEPGDILPVTGEPMEEEPAVEQKKKKKKKIVLRWLDHEDELFEDDGFCFDTERLKKADRIDAKCVCSFRYIWKER